MFTFALAIGILLMGDDLEALEEALFGDIAQVTVYYMAAGVVISIVAHTSNKANLPQACLSHDF